MSGFATEMILYNCID